MIERAVFILNQYLILVITYTRILVYQFIIRTDCDSFFLCRYLSSELLNETRNATRINEKCRKQIITSMKKISADEYLRAIFDKYP